jgi:hypothetical protein
MKNPILREYIMSNNTNDISKNDKTFDGTLDEIKSKLERLNSMLVLDLTKEIKDTNKYYKELIYLAGELDAYLAKW